MTTSIHPRIGQRSALTRSLCAITGCVGGVGVYLLLLLLADTLAGSRQLMAWVLFESRSGLIRLIFADLLTSLPITAPVLFGTAYAALWVLGHSGMRHTMTLVAAIALLTCGLCAALGFHIVQGVIFGSAVSGAMLTAILFDRACTCKKPG